MRKATIALVFAAVVAGTLPASAAGALPKVAQRTDPEDVKGRLDIVRTRVSVGAERVRLTVETADRWRCRYVKDDASTAEGAAAVYEDGKGIFFFWEFDTNKDASFERDAFFRCKDGKVRLVSDGLHRSVRARKPDGRTVTATLSRKRWEMTGRRLQLRAVSQVNGVDGADTFVEERDDTRRLRPFR
ncbi:MAG TPA: hypothetical protein VEU29_06025 [Actinomycetota bacterium]|nr:hypothetical protein [Actinomycetota bacterium]